MPDEISTTEAAELLELTRQRVLQLIKEEILSARKIGNYYAITRQSVEAYRAKREDKEGGE